MYHLNENKLNGTLVEKGYTKEGLAMALGIDRATLFRRIKNNRLLLADVHKIMEVLNLTTDEAINIFLN